MNWGCLILTILSGISWILSRKSTPTVQVVTSRKEAAASASFVLMNLVFLGYCAIAYYNPRATFSEDTQDFTYFENYKPWLPTTYDRDLTGQQLVDFLAFFGFFWSVRWWLNRGWCQTLERGRTNPTIFNNRRFRILAWTLTINAIALAFQSTLQRLTSSQKLLWLRDSWWKSPDFCFGPFSYRGNAAEYFNLMWPLALGFCFLFFKSKKDPRRRLAFEGPQLLLIPGLILLSVAPFLSLSRGGAIVAGMGLTGFVFLLASEYWRSWSAKVALLAGIVVFAVVLWVSTSKELLVRFELVKGDLSGRKEIYENSKKITEDFPLFGTGPGTFRSVYELYRPSVSQSWHAFLHDDWLETRVCYGWIGFSLVCLQLLTFVIWIFAPGRAPVPRILFGCLLISLGGTLLKAKFDFPFQTYSIFLTFILVSAITVSGSKEKF
jgi:hypothetical protein